MGWRVLITNKMDMYFDENPNRHKRNHLLSGFIGFIFYSIISTLIFLLVYSFLFYPGMISESYEITKDKIVDTGYTISNNLNIKSSSTLQNTDTSSSSKDSCRQQFNYYSNIGKGKYNVRSSITSVQIINNQNEADEFDVLYSGLLFSFGRIAENKIDSYPIVAISGNMKNQLGETFPIIIVCDNSGKITDISKNILSMSF